MNKTTKNPQRRKRTLFVNTVSVILFVVVGIYLLISVQALIVPFIFGAIAAYIGMPLLTRLNQLGIPNGFSILILFLVFVLSVYIISRETIKFLSDEQQMMELKVNIQYQFNDRYTHYFNFDENQDKHKQGNLIYNIFSDEIEPLRDSFNRFMVLDEEESQLLEEYRNTLDNYGEPLISDQTWENYLYNQNQFGHLLDDAEADQPDETELMRDSILGSLFGVLSIWFIMPVVFLFMLVDNGHLKKVLIRSIPNTYFEMAFTALDNVDKAIGNYLRGTAVQVLLVSLSFWILLILIGFDWGSSLFLALIGGLTNIIPYFGSVIGLAVISIYSLIVPEISPVIPFVDTDNLILWSIAVVLIVQLLDNIYFKPVIFGKITNLHPLIVFLGAIAGSIMFGFWGLLFAMPVIIIIKELYTTIHQQLKAYFIIY